MKSKEKSRATTELANEVRHGIGWSLLALIAGMAAGGIVVSIGEGISSQRYPPPEGLELPRDMEQFREFVATLPTPAFVIILVSHAGGSLAAGWTCSYFKRLPWYLGAFSLGAFLTASGVANLFTIPHPPWFAVADTLVYVPCTLLGARLYPRGATDQATNKKQRRRK